ncbi:MAG: HD domain-containing protein [Acidaminococcales bacterium]|nr:HD domain-containing protein [Acidaminococcales bacterium]
MSDFIDQTTLALEEEGPVNAIAFTWLNRLRVKNKTVYNHSIQVANYAVSIGAKMGLPEEEISVLKAAALLHDIGKLALPNELLRRLPCVYKREVSLYKRHCDMGMNMLENEPGFKDNICVFIRSHHERWDGKGFPRRLKGSNIPLSARIIGVADYYDTVNPCSGNWPKTVKAAMREVFEQSGTAFDPEVVKALAGALGH